MNTALTLPVLTAAELPDKIKEAMPQIVEDASQAAFTKIHEHLTALGYPATGDVMPGEHLVLEEVFQQFVRMAALNNAAICDLNDIGDLDSLDADVKELVRRMAAGYTAWQEGHCASPDDKDHVIDGLEVLGLDLDEETVEAIAHELFIDAGEKYFTQASVAAFVIRRIKEEVAS